ncbi:Smr/MutS family protein [Ferruginibacter lapsinanis]|uniref:Smr/MutS family protein n=1 Tax=Ferruginibacter lapsinanis TaxID=563172 RepID=UPI001E2CCDBE|nr:Smr/MutS family protein [Ferruginibacter lapsinanis]UEG49189.1 Smr/MutS family protein [Ferruginibacter lapsinanis]
MKYEVGDKIVVNLTDEEGVVVDIMNEKMVMIEVKGVKFPAYTDQIDFPYFKMFSQKKTVPKQKVYAEDVKKEKGSSKQKVADGVFISFVPVFEKDIFDDAVVEKFKLYLINQTDTELDFTYTLLLNGVNDFELKNSILPLNDFYLHDVQFELLSDNPRFDFEFSLTKPDKKKAEYFESSLKIKAKQLFKRIEEMQIKNEPSFSYLLFQEYPDRIETEKVDLSKLGNAGFRIYGAHEIRQNMPSAQSVVDLHIEKLTDDWKHLSNYDILTIQLKAFEKYYDLAISHFQPSLIIIHGVGTGKLKNEIHEILKAKKHVKSFANQYHHRFGYGATEIYFEY